jgi:hypothetical protein
MWEGQLGSGLKKSAAPGLNSYRAAGVRTNTWTYDPNRISRISKYWYPDPGSLKRTTGIIANHPDTGGWCVSLFDGGTWLQVTGQEVAKTATKARSANQPGPGSGELSYNLRC